MLVLNIDSKYKNMTDWPGDRIESEVLLNDLGGDCNALMNQYFYTPLANTLHMMTS